MIADHFFTVLLAKAGLERYSRDPAWWANTKAGQDKNRQKYHALQAKALAVTNFQMRQVLNNCPQDALKASRRFRPLNRHAVHCEIIRDPRFLQLVDTFPIALMVIADCEPDVRSEARRLVEKGVRLKVLADFLSLPTWTRKLKPGVVLGTAWLKDDDSDCLPRIERLAHTYLPETTAAQKLWVVAVTDAGHAAGGPFVEWTARHAHALGDTRDQIRATVQDIGDWVQASYLSDVPPHVQKLVLRAHGFQPASRDAPDASLITRPFTPDMSPDTVRELTARWHETVALAKHDNRQRRQRGWWSACALRPLRSREAPDWSNSSLA